MGWILRQKETGKRCGKRQDSHDRDRGKCKDRDKDIGIGIMQERPREVGNEFRNIYNDDGGGAGAGKGKGQLQRHDKNTVSTDKAGTRKD